MYILVEETDYAQGISKVFNSTFSGLGGTVTSESYPSNSNDLRPLVTKAKTAKPDAFLMIPQTPASAQKILKAIKDLGWKPKLLVGDIVAGDPDTMSQYKDVLSGAYVAEVGTDPNNAIFNHALEVYKLNVGKDMSFQGYGQAIWDALFLVRDGIKAVGNDGAKLADWFRTVKDWQGASGSVTIGADGDPVIGHRAELIKDGKVEVVK